jgi:hypothetical protein
VRNTLRNNAGFAASRSGQQKKRTLHVSYRLTLLRI